MDICARPGGTLDVEGADGIRVSVLDVTRRTRRGVVLRGSLEASAQLGDRRMAQRYFLGESLPHHALTLRPGRGADRDEGTWRFGHDCPERLAPLPFQVEVGSPG